MDHDDDDDHGLFWEEHAREAVETLLGEVLFDEIRGTVILSTPEEDEQRISGEFSSMEEVETYLREVYEREWYAYVPFDGGEAVFEDDSWGVVGDLLSDHHEIVEFFEQQERPEHSDVLVAAKELLKDAHASRAIRVSAEDINDELVHYLADNPKLMREMSPRKFEELVAAMFESKGYEVTLTPPSKDGGRDVIAIHRSGLGTAMVITECKRYAEDKKVGVAIVRGLYGVVEEQRATRGIVATTSFFTKGAKAFRERVPYRLELADFDTLRKEIVSWKLRNRQ